MGFDHHQRAHFSFICTQRSRNTTRPSAEAPSTSLVSPPKHSAAVSATIQIIHLAHVVSLASESHVIRHRLSSTLGCFWFASAMSISCRRNDQKLASCSVLRKLPVTPLAWTSSRWACALTMAADPERCCLKSMPYTDEFICS